MKKKSRLKFKKVHLLVLVAVLFYIGLVFLAKGGLPWTTNTTSPQQAQGVRPEKKIEISGVKINDFMSQGGSQGTPSYYTIEKTADYHLFYIPSQELFYISITSYPFDKNRTQAEAAFLTALGIGQQEACKLKVDLTTPAYANPDQAGEIFGLSFCNGQE
jgi:hypothetical protein